MADVDRELPGISCRRCITHGDHRVDISTGEMLRLAYEWGNWSAAFFVNNVTNKAYRVASVDGSGILGYTQQTYAPPRWFGGSITIRYR